MPQIRYATGHVVFYFLPKFLFRGSNNLEMIFVHFIWKCGLMIYFYFKNVCLFVCFFFNKIIPLFTFKNISPKYVQIFMYLVRLNHFLLLLNSAWKKITKPFYKNATLFLSFNISDLWMARKYKKVVSHISARYIQNLFLGEIAIEWFTSSNPFHAVSQLSVWPSLLSPPVHVDLEEPGVFSSLAYLPCS